MLVNNLKSIVMGWNWVRLFRLAFGILVLYNGLIAMDWLLIIIGGSLSFLAVFNLGCGLTSGSCHAAPPVKSRNGLPSTD